jgi:hypothetical protein
MDKKFLDLLSVLDTGLDEAEGGSHCVFYTLIILINALERIYNQKPMLVVELLNKHRFLRAEDWTVSACEMGNYFDDTIAFMEEQLGIFFNFCCESFPNERSCSNPG